jgi:hypothetical protein
MPGEAMKRTVFPTFAVLAVLSFAGYRYAEGQESAFEIARGKQISPVTLNLNGKNPALVYLGSYLVNGVGGCNDCHTCPSYKGTNPFMVGGQALGPVTTPGPVNATNYLAGGVPFGPLTSPNLTPDSSGRPGGMDFTKFANAIQNGADPDHPGQILQIMPWPVYRHMTTTDLAAVYSYLSALPPAQPGACTGSGETGP